LQLKYQIDLKLQSMPLEYSLSSDVKVWPRGQALTFRNTNNPHRNKQHQASTILIYNFFQNCNEVAIAAANI